MLHLGRPGGAEGGAAFTSAVHMVHAKTIHTKKNPLGLLHLDLINFNMFITFYHFGIPGNHIDTLYPWTLGSYICFTDLKTSTHITTHHYDSLAKAHAWARWVADPPVRDVADELQPAVNDLLGSATQVVMFCGDGPLHSPYVGLIYDRYLQFRSMK